MEAHHRATPVSVDAAEARRLGLTRGAGQYSLAWDRNGAFTFKNQHSGEQYQIGTFGRRGRDEQNVDIEKNVYDHRPVHKDGGVEMSVYDPKTGKLSEGVGVYKDGQLQLQAGKESSGIYQDVLVSKPAVYQLGELEGTVGTDEKGNVTFISKGGDKFTVLDVRALTLKTPGGLVHFSGKATPDGKRVEGKESSVIVSEGQFTDPTTHKQFRGISYTDSRTGIALVQNYESGDFYKYTWGKRADAVSLGISIQGDVTASAMKGMAKKIGMSDEAANDMGLYTGVGMKGLKEVGQALKYAKDIFGRRNSTKGESTDPSYKPEGPMSDYDPSKGWGGGNPAAKNPRNYPKGYFPPP